MLTWLDVWVINHHASYEKLRPHEYPHMASYNNPVDCIRAMLAHSRTQNANFTITNLRKYVENNRNDARARRHGVQMMMGLVIDKIINNQALSIQPTVDLIHDFKDAKAPQTREWTKLFDSYSAIYIDFPPQSLMLDNGYHIRAIMLTQDDDRTTAIVCIPSRDINDLGSEIELVFDLYNTSNLIVRSDVPVSLGVESPAFIHNIRNLIILTLLYYQVQSNHQTLPRIKDSDYASIRAPHKRRNKLRHMTLFSITRLHSPTDRFGRKSSGSTTYKLTHSVEVKGHFRFQPYGPSGSQRKLIWISSYSKGPDVIKPRLVKL